MMKYYSGDFGYGYGGMMGGGLVTSLICVVIFIDLVLLGVWLWKKIEKEGKNHNN